MMAIFTCLMVFLSILASGVREAKSDSPALTYWKEKLPNTPIPNTLRELIVPEKKSAVNRGALQPSGGKHSDILYYTTYRKKADNGAAVHPNADHGAALQPSGRKHSDILYYTSYRKKADNGAAVLPNADHGAALQPSGRKHSDILYYNSYRKKADNGAAVHPNADHGAAVQPSGRKHSDILYYNSYRKTAVDGGNNGKNEMLADPELTVFFLEKDIRVGAKKVVYLKRSDDTPAYFLPRHQADKIPFTSEKLSVALKSLNISEASEWTSIMKETLEKCERPPSNGESSKHCATSLESMIDYSTSTLGTNHLNVLMSEVPKNALMQEYTITAVSNKSASTVVACHTEVYVYSVYYCHEQSKTHTMKISLKADDGTTEEGVTVCHEDTSAWDPDHVAFQVLNVKPGGPSICHFLPQDHLLWVPAN